MGLNLEQTPVASFPRKERWRGDQRGQGESERFTFQRRSRGGCRKMLNISIHQEG